MHVFVLDFLYLPEVVDRLVELLHSPGDRLYLPPLRIQLLQPAVLLLLLLVQLGQFQEVLV